MVIHLLHIIFKNWTTKIFHNALSLKAISKLNAAEEQSTQDDLHCQYEVM